MKASIIVLLLLTLLHNTYQAPLVTAHAISSLRGTTGNRAITGVVEFHQNLNSTNVTGTFSGLKPNTLYSVNIHELGLLTADGKGIGGHWNPHNTSHGHHGQSGSHAGNLGNLTSNARGVATFKSYQNSQVELTGMNSILGRSVALTEGQSQNHGSNVAILAQGVIGLSFNNETTATQQTSDFATCELLGVDEEYITGRVNFEKVSDTQLLVTVVVCDLIPKTSHLIHVHTFGDLTGDDRAEHLGPEYAELGNFTVDATGTINVTRTLNLTLRDAKSIAGRSVIVQGSGAHADHDHDHDDLAEDDDHGAENNLASCVIGIVNQKAPVTTSCPPVVFKAVAHLEGKTGYENIHGDIDIIENLDHSSNLTAMFEGLKPNTTYAFNIHEFGFIGSADGHGIGPHYNPGNHSDHGNHAGDLGNLTSNGNGVAVFTTHFNNGIELHGGESIVGRSFALHEGPSREYTPYEKFIAEGVIGITNAANNFADQRAAKIATCELHATSETSNITGRVNFEQLSATQMRVSVVICGLNKSVNPLHGLHVHEFGDLHGTPIGTQVGGHFNPLDKPHGYPWTLERHVGDMGNFTVDDNGSVVQTKVLDLLTLSKSYSIAGRAVVLHQRNDDGSQPTGNAGPKIAVCAIGIVKTVPPLPTCPSLNPTAAPTPTPNTSGPTPTPNPSGPTPTTKPVISSGNKVVVTSLVFVGTIALFLF